MKTQSEVHSIVQNFKPLLCAVVIARVAGLSAADLFVGTQAGDYATLSEAVAAAQDGDAVILRAGTHEAATEVVITRPLTVRGITGDPDDVVVKAVGNHRLFKLGHAQAKVSGLTLRDGNAGGESGGAVYITADGGTLENSIVTDCRNTGWGVPGGGIYVAKNADSGLIDRCIVKNSACGNRQGAGGGVALALYGGVARNSLFIENRHSDNSGGNQNLCGTVKVSGGKLVNCTVARNNSYTCPGVWAESGLVLNCIIAENTSESSLDKGYTAWAGNASCFSNCVSAVAINEFCLEMEHPFSDADNGDFSPILGSAGVDSGAAEDWMASALDLLGRPRVSGSAPDAGAIEYDQSLFSAAFSASPSFGTAPLSVNFSVTTAGGTGPYLCSWDWDGDGVADETTSGDVAHTFSNPCLANVGLTVKDTATGNTFSVPRPVPVKVFGDAVRVVAGNANSAPPYDRQENAAATLEAAYAFAEDGTEIVISGGTHDVSAEIKVTKAVTIRGATGRPEDVVLKAKGSHRMFMLANPAAKITGVTIRDGNSGALSGGGVYIDTAGGVLENSIVHSCKATGWGKPGGGIYVAPGADNALIDRCVVSNSICHRQGGGGGTALAIYGG